jgi:hypothetical protein
MQPPWKTHPDIPFGSIGWRMGCGEEAYDAFYQSFSKLSDREKSAFERENPEPPGWEGLYETIRSHPWA